MGVPEEYCACLRSNSDLGDSMKKGQKTGVMPSSATHWLSNFTSVTFNLATHLHSIDLGGAPSFVFCESSSDDSNYTVRVEELCLKRQLNLSGPQFFPL